MMKESKKNHREEHLVNLQLTKEGEFIMSTKISSSLVHYLSKSGAPYDRALRVLPDMTSIQFVVSLPSLKIQDPLNTLSTIICLEEPDSCYLFELVGRFGGLGGSHFMSDLFRWLKVWNAASDNELTSLKWVTHDYLWSLNGDGDMPITISSEPLKLADDSSEVRYIWIEITGLNAAGDSSHRNGIKHQSSDVSGNVASHVQFTKREEEILLLLRQGMTSREIADLFFVSEHTVKNHRKNMMRKAGVSNVIELLNRTAHLPIGE